MIFVSEKPYLLFCNLDPNFKMPCRVWQSKFYSIRDCINTNVHIPRLLPPIATRFRMTYPKAKKIRLPDTEYFENSVWLRCQI